MSRRAIGPIAVVASIAMVCALLATVDGTAGAALDPRVVEVTVSDLLDPHDFADLAFDSAGNLWLADAQQPVLTRIDSTGSVVSSIGLRSDQTPGGTLTGGFNGLVAGSDGSLWASAPDDQLIVRVDPSTSPPGVLTVAAPSNSVPGGLRLVSDTEVRWVGVDIPEVATATFDALAGTLTAGAALPLPASSAPADLAVAGDGSTWVALSGEAHVVHLAVDGSTIHTYDAGVDPRGLTIATDGTVWYVAGSGSLVGHIDPTTDDISRFTMNHTAEPRDVTMGADGNAWFTDAGRSRIGRVTGAGTITTFQLTAPNHVNGIVAAGDGELWSASAEGGVMHLPAADPAPPTTTTTSTTTTSTTTTEPPPPPPPPPAPEPPAVTPQPVASGPTDEQVKQFLLFVFFLRVAQMQAAAKKKCRTVTTRVHGKRVVRQVCGR